MSDNTKHLAKKCVKDAGPCLVLCLAAQRSRCWLFWGRLMCSEVLVLCAFAWLLPAP